MQVPKLRFKEFTDNWEYCIIKDTFENISIKNHPEMTILTIIQGNGTIPRNQSNRNIIFDEEKSFTYKVVNKNDFIIHLRSFEGGLEMSNYDGIVSPAYTILRGNDKVIPLFFKYYFRTNKFINGILSKAVEGIRDGRQISYNQLKDFNIPLPSLEEQTKISNFLSLIDEKIELQQKLVNSLELYKKGLLQKVFSNNSGWNYVKLYSVCDVRDGTHNSPKYIENGYPLVTSKNLSKNGKLDFSDISYISKQDYDEINKRSMVNVGDILFGMIGTIGNPVLLNKDGFAIKNIALIKEKTKLKNKFLIQFLNSSFIERQFDFNKTGGTQKFIGLNSIRQLLVPIPSIEEQNKIADLFTNLDKKIDFETNKLNNLKEYKKGLLQQMFI